MNILSAIITLLLFAGGFNATFAENLECKKVDQYSGVICDDEVMRLLRFRDLLNAQPNMNGYIVVYGGQGERQGESQAHAERLRDAFINNMGIDNKRFMVVHGGYRQNWTVEIWLCPNEANKPISTPNIQPKYLKFRSGKIKKSEYKWSANAC